MDRAEPRGPGRDEVAPQQNSGLGQQAERCHPCTLYNGRMARKILKSRRSRSLETGWPETYVEKIFSKNSNGTKRLQSRLCNMRIWLVSLWTRTGHGHKSLNCQVSDRITPAIRDVIEVSAN